MPKPIAITRADVENSIKQGDLTKEQGNAALRVIWHFEMFPYLLLEPPKSEGD